MAMPCPAVSNALRNRPPTAAGPDHFLVLSVILQTTWFQEAHSFSRGHTLARVARWVFDLLTEDCLLHSRSVGA